MEVLLAVIQKADNIAILVLLAMVGLMVFWRREEREDRKQLYALIQQNTDALNAIKNILSAMTGKPL